MEDVRVYGDFHRINPDMWDKIKGRYAPSSR